MCLGEFICLFICLPMFETTTDLSELFYVGKSWPKEEVIKF